MSDIVEQLRKRQLPLGGTFELMDEAAAEIERLRAALKSCHCPGGGWNGMPDNMEPTIENCMKHDACGCCYGNILGYQ
jgi:hypothetical protein